VFLLQAPCCGKVYACRLCHNDAELHEIDRRSIVDVVCNVCGTRQPVSVYTFTDVTIYIWLVFSSGFCFCGIEIYDVMYDIYTVVQKNQTPAIFCKYLQHILININNFWCTESMKTV